MSDPRDRPTGEDALYASLLAFLSRNGFLIALAAPLLLLSLVVKGDALLPLVAVVLLGEAIVYGAVQTRPRGGRPGPAASLQVLWVVLAALLIIGGLFWLGAGQPAAIAAIGLGVGIVVCMWARVARASGENSAGFVAWIVVAVAAAGAAVVGLVGVATAGSAISIPGFVVIPLAFGLGGGVVSWFVSKTRR
jgi:hypothetical protein